MNGYVQQFAEGLLLTLQVSTGSFVIGLMFGVFGAAAKLSRKRVWRWLGGLYTTVVRALPELLLLLICFYILAARLAALASWVGLAPADFTFDPFLVAVFALGLIQGAYLTEVFRMAVQEIAQGQFEACDSLSLGFFPRWWFVLGPAMLRNALPATGNVWLNATKDSSLISIVGAFADVLKVGGMAAASTKQYLFFYSMSAVVFLGISLVSIWLLKALHVRSGKGLRAR